MSTESHDGKQGGRLVIGVDLGGTKINAAAVSEGGEILAAHREKTHAEEGPEAVIGRIAGLVKEVVKALGATPADVAALCIGVPGQVNDATGVVDEAPNLRWHGVQLSRALATQLGGEPLIVLDNDVRVALLGEHAFGAGRGLDSMVGVAVGTGIGGGVVVSGSLLAGARSAAGEIGHMILDPRGPRCSFGHHGCAEALASRSAMGRDVQQRLDRGQRSVIPHLLKEMKRDQITSSVIARALDADDKVMRKVLERAQRYLGLLVGSVINLLDPQAVVFFGGLSERLGERLVGPIRELARTQLIQQRDRDGIRIVSSTLADRAAPIGAAWLARRRLDFRAASLTLRSPGD